MERLARFLALCCVLLVLAGLRLAAPGAVAAAPAVQMQAEAPVGGAVKRGGWMTIFVELTSPGADLQGELVVEAAVESAHPQYVVPVSLAAGETRRVPVNLAAEAGRIRVALYVGGEEVARQEVALSDQPAEAAIVGVLSGHERGLPVLEQLRGIDSRTARVVRLDAETFPDRVSLLEDYNLIAIAGFDTAALRPEQLRALEGWVARGGTLLLVGGPDWERTLSPLPDFLLPVEVTGVRDVPLDPLAALAHPTDTGGGQPAGHGAGGAVEVSAAEVRRGQVLVESDGVPLVVSAAAGAGRVLYVAFDPALAPVADWPGQVPLFERLVRGALVPTALWKDAGLWSLRNALQQISEWAMPSLWLVGFLLGGYILLVGPLNYLVLKRMDRREWAWLTVPVLAVLYMGAVYLMGFSRYNPLVGHVITVTELSPGSPVATVNTYVGLYSPSQRQVSAEVGGSPLVRALAWQSGGRQGVFARVVTGEPTRVEMLDMSSYRMNAFWVQEDVALSGGLELVDARVEDGTIAGRIRNSLDRPATDVVLALGEAHVWLERLEPGQTSDLVTLPLPAGGAKPGWYPFYYRRYDELRRPGVDEQRRRWILDMVYEQLRGRNTTGMLLVGWTEEPVRAPDLSLAGETVGGANMVYAVLPLPGAGEGGDIPAGAIQGNPSDPDTADWLPDGYLLKAPRVRFTIALPPLDMSRVEGITLAGLPPLEEGLPLQVFVRNQQTGEWIPVTGQEQPLPDWWAYVSPAGEIELLYQAQAFVQVPAPTVAVRGVSD